MSSLDATDRALLAMLQQDATAPYSALAGHIGLSVGATHERVRKLRDRGVIQRTTVDVDPVAVGLGVLAFVLVESSEWMGDAETRQAFEGIAEIEEAHIVAGAASLVLKVRTSTTVALQAVLRRIFDVRGVHATQTIMVLESFFERPPDVAGA